MLELFYPHQVDKDLSSRIKLETIQRVSRTHWKDVAPCPTHCLCHNPTREKLFLLAAQFIPYRPSRQEWTNAVYVLECRTRGESQLAAAHAEFELQNPWWVRAAEASDRLIYVGVSERVLTRLEEHIAANGAGANFTTIFPPVRILDISWYASRSEAYRAEELTAQHLDDDTPDSTFVYQPG